MKHNDDDELCPGCGNPELYCVCDPPGPGDGDVTTSNFSEFYRGDTLWLTVYPYPDYRAALKAKMGRVSFRPRVWFVPDHGDPRLLDPGGWPPR